MKSIAIFLKENWELILGLSTGIGAVISFILTRQNELAWKRTEFICTQSQYLDTDADLIEMVTILEGRHQSVSIEQLYTPDSSLDEGEKRRYQQKFDKLLNFLWRLCFAHLHLKTLSRREIVCVGWYLWSIGQHPPLIDYCLAHGYDDIVTVIKRQNYIGQVRPLKIGASGRPSKPVS